MAKPNYRRTVSLNVAIKFTIAIPKEKIPNKYISERGTVKKEYIAKLKKEYDERIGDAVSHLVWDTSKITRGKGKYKDSVGSIESKVTIGR